MILYVKNTDFLHCSIYLKGVFKKSVYKDFGVPTVVSPKLKYLSHSTIAVFTRELFQF